MSSFLHEIEEVCFHSSKKPGDKSLKADHSCCRSHYTQYLPDFYIWSTSRAFLTWLCGSAMSLPALLMWLCLPGVHTRSAEPYQEQKLWLLWGGQGARALLWVSLAAPAMSFFLFCFRAHKQQHSLHFVNIPCTENSSVLTFLHWSHTEGTSTSWILFPEQYFSFWALLYCLPLSLCILNSHLQYCPICTKEDFAQSNKKKYFSHVLPEWKSEIKMFGAFFLMTAPGGQSRTSPTLPEVISFFVGIQFINVSITIDITIDVQFETKHLKKCSKAPVVWHRNTSHSILNRDRYRPEEQLFHPDHTWTATYMRVSRVQAKMCHTHSFLLTHLYDCPVKKEN